jgi:hypothetical protein
MNLILLGAIIMACFTVSLLFLRFWKSTRDRFFLFFAASFLIEGCNRLMLGLIHYSSEQEPLFYLLRLFAFLIILWAIFDKNWLNARKL